MPQSFTKDPSAILDYTIDWSSWLDDDTIATSTWVVPSGITKTTDTKTTTTTTIWVSGGTLDTSYQLVNRVVTVGGRTDDRSIFIRIANK